MNTLFDDVSVGLVLSASAGYAAYSLGPRTLRRRMLESGAALLMRLPRSLGLRGLALRWQAAAITAKGSCGGCDSCEPQPPGAPTSASDKAPAPEIRIAVSTIGKRR
jgi:hypothetical protein